MKVNKLFLKNIFIIFLTLIVAICFFIPVLAVEEEEEEVTLPDPNTLTSVYRTAYNMALTVYASDQSELVKEVKDVVLYVPGVTAKETEDLSVIQRQTTMDAIWRYAEEAYSGLEAIAAGIALLYFLLEILDKTTREMMSLEHFLIHFLKFIIAIFILNNGFKLIEGLMVINSDICDALSKISLDDGEIRKETWLVEYVYKEVSQGGFSSTVAALTNIVELSVPYFCTLAAHAYITFMCWSRFFEIGIRAAFSPIGMLDVITEGFKITHLKYIKKLFATILQGTIILIVMELVGSAYTALSLSPSVATGGFAYVIILFVEIGLIKKAQSLANDVLGT